MERNASKRSLTKRPSCDSMRATIFSYKALCPSFLIRAMTENDKIHDCKDEILLDLDRNNDELPLCLEEMLRGRQYREIYGKLAKRSNGNEVGITAESLLESFKRFPRVISRSPSDTKIFPKFELDEFQQVISKLKEFSSPDKHGTALDIQEFSAVFEQFISKKSYSEGEMMRACLELFNGDIKKMMTAVGGFAMTDDELQGISDEIKKWP